MTCQVRWGVVSSTASCPPGSLPPGVCPQLCSHLTLEWGCLLPVAAGEVTLLYLGFGYEGLWLGLVCSLSCGLSFLDHLLWGSQLPCCGDSEAAVERPMGTPGQQPGSVSVRGLCGPSGLFAIP